MYITRQVQRYFTFDRWSNNFPDTIVESLFFFFDFVGLLSWKHLNRLIKNKASPDWYYYIYLVTLSYIF